MNVTFWHFNKRVNSTKTPTTEGTTLNAVYLKEQTDINKPILEIRSLNLSEYNYAKIGTRFYFVDTIESKANNLWVVSLSLDLLATYKNEILQTKAYVLYSTNNFNKNLIDSRIVTSGKHIMVWAEGTNILDKGGTFIVSAVSEFALQTGATGLTTTYYLTPSQMRSLSREFNNRDIWDDIKQWWTNPIEAIVEIAWIPLEVGKYLTMKEVDIIIGGYTTQTKASVPDYAIGIVDYSNVVNSSQWIDIPWQYDKEDFRNLSPYTTMEFYFPGCGFIPLDVADFYADNELFMEYSIDIVTGNIELRIFNAINMVGTASANIKVQLPISQVQTRLSSIVDMTAGIIATTALAASGHPAAAVTSGAYAVGNVLTPQHTVNNSGLNGSFINGNSLNKPTLYLTIKETNDVPDNFTNVCGRVCAKVLTLSECSGYVRTENASVAISGLLSDSQAINSMLNGGVYIE